MPQQTQTDPLLSHSSLFPSGRTTPQSVVQCDPQTKLTKLSSDDNVQTGRVEIPQGCKKTSSTNFRISFAAKAENSVKTGNF
jgi:hypothetical protein